MHLDPVSAMKWLFALLLRSSSFGGAALFQLQPLRKQEIAVREGNNAAKIPVRTAPDISLPEFQAAAKLQQEKKLRRHETP